MPEPISKNSACECAGCDCDSLATCRDNQGIPVCDVCQDYFTGSGGEVICGRMFDGKSCHICGEEVRWGGVVAGNGSAFNYAPGSCACGELVWLDEEKGYWGNYSYYAKIMDEQNCDYCGGSGKRATAMTTKGRDLDRYEKHGTPCPECKNK